MCEKRSGNWSWKRNGNESPFRGFSSSTELKRVESDSMKTTIRQFWKIVGEERAKEEMITLLFLGDVKEPVTTRNLDRLVRSTLETAC